jgi:hypothetical protein
MQLPESPAEINLIADEGIETLRARVKAIAREHSDRIHKLNVLKRKIVVSRHAEAGLPGMPALSIEPDLQKLLVDPTHGL